MSTVSRICLPCRIRILSNCLTLHSASLPRSRDTTQRNLSRALRLRDQLPQSRLYSTKSTKCTHIPDDPATPIERPSKPKNDFDAMADPVLVKLTGIVEPLVETPPRRASKAITAVDVQEFLAKAKKATGRAKAPSGADAHMIDEKYGELLSGSIPLRNRSDIIEVPVPSKPPPPLEDLKSKFKYPSATHTIDEIYTYLGDKQVTVHGYVKSARRVNKRLVFLDLYDFRRPDASIQAISSIHLRSSEERKAIQNRLLKLPPFVPVAVTGTVTKTQSLPAPGVLSGEESKEWNKESTHRPEILMESLIELNSVSPDLIYTPETIFPPQKRHLQLRTSSLLRRALHMRNTVSDVCRMALRRKEFLEVETPLLFKSTPEGAREFLVPTRTQGMCYALPQSPQQYKQILMASGVPRYFQFARCFRDEDLRADRQPEFTQLDLEMSFARGEDVMRVVQTLIKDIFYKTLGIDLPFEFQRMTYKEAMQSYGTDKPDLRLGVLKIHRAHFTHRPGSVETFHIKRGKDHSFEAMKNVHDSFVADFENEPFRFRSYVAGEDSAYGIPGAALSAQDIEDVNERLNIEEGDIVVLKRRHGEFQGGSTYMGRLRQGLINKAIEAGVLQRPKGYEPVWITEFPLFTPVSPNETEPGQSGTIGLASTHHPFTAPYEDDFALLATEPLKVRAEHYDIVINGAELGGGSRRIHDPELQRYILEDVIKIHPDKLHQFDHLLDVLGSGCPPHAGIAIGFDRLMSLLVGTNNIRDTIAFPKNQNGTDPLVGSPSLVSDEDLATYGLRRTRQ